MFKTIFFLGCSALAAANVSAHADSSESSSQNSALDRQPQHQRRNSDLRPEELIGEYEFSEKHFVMINVDRRHRVFAQFDERPLVEIHEIAPDVFSDNRSSVTLTFKRFANGSVPSVSISSTAGFLETFASQ